jgi:hypothetical protein
VLGVCPVEEGRADQAHMRRPGRRGAEPDTHGRFGSDGRDGGSVRRGSSSHSGSNFTACRMSCRLPSR